MKNTITIILLFLSAQAIAQNPTTYKIETLTKPVNLLHQTTPKNIFLSLKANIEKSSPLPDSLVSYGEHPFLTGILMAYEQHRPFVISPDIVWLLISQGFARHIANNAEEFRKDILNFKTKKDLTVIANDIQPGNAKSNWEALFPQFTRQITDYTGREFANKLTADFSTTTPVTKIVSQITVMETVKAYFNYKIYIIGCGIPEITIEGTIKDWENIMDKTRYISKYDLKWWTSELEPIIEQIIQAKKGHFDKKFWMNMVEVHIGKACVSPTVINGWIIKFFPYTKEGKKTGLKPISETSINGLASEIVKVPFTLEDEQTHKNYKMEFWGGFIGLSQNKSNYTLKPEIGWVINNQTKFDSKNSEFKNQKEIDDLSINNVDTIPADIYSLQKIGFLHISFLKDIIIPDELAKIKIANLELNGDITEQEELKIKKMFPDTKLTINSERN